MDKDLRGTDADAAFSIQQNIDGGYIIAGWTYSIGAGAQSSAVGRER